MSPRIYGTLLLVVLLFAAAQRLAPLQRLLTVRPILFLGFISYPLYLVHNSLGVGLIMLLGPRLAPIASVWAVPIVALPIVLLAWLIARYGEPPLTRLMRRGTDRIRARGAISA
jgi:peptidoglycan/LPS O-acetylase OafA/YrhL